MIRFFFTIERHEPELAALPQKIDLIAAAKTENDLRAVENTMLNHFRKTFPNITAVNIFNFEALA